METLNQDLYQQIQSLCEQGDEFADNEQYDEAVKQFQTAWKLLPEPKKQWEVATYILIALGDVHFLRGKYHKAIESLNEALADINEADNAFIYLRLGQSRFELGEMQAAKEALQTADELDDEIWDGEDEKYRLLIQ